MSHVAISGDAELMDFLLFITFRLRLDLHLISTMYCFVYS